MVSFLKSNLLLVLAAGVGVWFYQKTDSAVKKATKPIADFLAEIQFAINGSHYIKYPRPGFALLEDKLTDDYVIISDEWVRAMLAAHDKHKAVFAEIFDDDRRLKPIYRPLVGQIVTPDAVKSVSGVDIG